MPVSAALRFPLDGEQMAFRQSLVGEDFFPHMKDRVNQKTATTSSSVDQRF